jgi:hypothetical protein
MEDYNIKETHMPLRAEPKDTQSYLNKHVSFHEDEYLDIPEVTLKRRSPAAPIASKPVFPAASEKPAKPAKAVVTSAPLVSNASFETPNIMMEMPSMPSIPSIPSIPSMESGFMHTLISLIHTIAAIFALYLSFVCNKGFDVPSFLAAGVCPYLYILYIFAVHPDFCGIRSSI